MAILEWSPSYVLGIALMDETHLEFADLVNQVGEVADGELAAKYDELMAHTVAHFEQENLWMKECGFPPIDCHVGEHTRVIQALQTVRKLLARGDLVIARRAAEEMAPWFANHAATMDTALALHIKRSNYTPVELQSQKAA